MGRYFHGLLSTAVVLLLPTVVVLLIPGQQAVAFILYKLLQPHVLRPAMLYVHEQQVAHDVAPYYETRIQETAVAQCKTRVFIQIVHVSMVMSYCNVLLLKCFCVFAFKHGKALINTTTRSLAITATVNIKDCLTDHDHRPHPSSKPHGLTSRTPRAWDHPAPAVRPCSPVRHHYFAAAYPLRSHLFAGLVWPLVYCLFRWYVVDDIYVDSLINGEGFACFACVVMHVCMERLNYHLISPFMHYFVHT
jgi:hypothetical protein